MVSSLCLCLLIRATHSGPTIPLIQRVEALEKEVTSLKDRIQKIEDRFAPADQNKNAPPSNISPEPQKADSDPDAKIVEKEMQKLINEGVIYKLIIPPNETAQATTVRITPLLWLDLEYDKKVDLCALFSRYTKLKGGTGDVMVLSSYADAELAYYSERGYVSIKR
jgi:hypothetical protein